MENNKKIQNFNEHQENLNISDVSKQRELLIFFLNHLNENLNLGVSDMWVDDFIKFGKKN